MPSTTTQPVFLAAVARPRSSISSMALAKSPSASVRAFLHSIMPQSVCLRSSITSFAEIAIVILSYSIRWGIRAEKSGVGGFLSGGSLLVALLALHDGVRHGAGDQLDSADGVVVAGDDPVDLIGVAVGIDDRNDGDVQLAGLGDGDALLVGIDDEQGLGQGLHVLHAAQVLVQLLHLQLQL